MRFHFCLQARFRECQRVEKLFRTAYQVQHRTVFACTQLSLKSKSKMLLTFDGY